MRGSNPARLPPSLEHQHAPQLRLPTMVSPFVPNPARGKAGHMVRAIRVFTKLRAAFNLPQHLPLVSQPPSAQRRKPKIVGPSTVVVLQSERIDRLPLDRFISRPRAKEFLEMLMGPEHRKSMPRDILMVNVTSVIGTHVGPNGLGVAAVRAE